MTSTFTVAVTGQSLIKHDIRSVRLPAFEEVCTILRRADLSFTNFEGTIRGRYAGWPLKGFFFGCSDPSVLDALKAAGFGALSLSNNHAFDLGPSGVLSTMEEVEKRGFLHAGLGRSHCEASRAGSATIGDRQSAIVAMDGGPGPDFMYAADADQGRPARPGVNRLRISQIIEIDEAAFAQLRLVREKVGYTDMALANDSQPDDPPRIDADEEIGIVGAVFKRSDGFRRTVKVDQADKARNLATIASAAADGCLVVAYLHHHHWAGNWHQVPVWVSSLARECIDAGAAMFVSHGAPVLQPVEIYRDRPIFYGLGNFIFHVEATKSIWSAPEVWESVVALCAFDQDNTLHGLTFYPVIIGGEFDDVEPERDLVPQLATGLRADLILRRFRELAGEFGTNIAIGDGVGTLNL